MSRHVPKAVLAELERRDDGRRCVLTGEVTERLVPQHRQGGMGGRIDKHRLPNLVWLDSIANGHIEAHAEWQAVAKTWGIKVPVWVVDVSRVPVFFRYEHAWFRLDSGNREEIPAAVALDMMHAVYGDEYFTWRNT